MKSLFWPGGEDETSESVARKGLVLLAIAFGTFLFWAIFVPLAEGVVAFGSVSVDGQRKAVQHLEGGIVYKLHVREGDQVDAKQLLIELDDTRAKAEHDLLFTRYTNMRASLVRLQTEIAGSDQMVLSVDLLSDMEDEATGERVQELVSVQQNLFETRQEQFRGEIELLENKIDLLERQTTGMRSELAAKREEVAFIEDELERMERLHKQDLVGLPRLLAQKRDRSQAVGQIGTIEASIAANELQVNEARLSILQLRKDRQEEVVKEMQDVQERMFEAQEQLVASTDVLERTYIRAPHAGKVLGLNVFTEGGVVPAGEPLMEIVPETSDQVVIEARIRNTDIDNIVPGMPVRTRFLALNQRRTPELTGTLEDVSGDAVMDENTGETFFMARVIINAEEAARITEDEIVPGMPAEILIEAGKRTAMEYLLTPLTDVFRRSMTED